MTVPCPSCQNPVVLSPETSICDAVSQPAAPESAAPAKKAARSNLTKLTAETIRTKIKSGDTPLHRAAKNGQFDLVPSHLLTIELFLEQNSAGETPLHVAAEHGHLDQVPLQFLTRETLTCRKAPPCTKRCAGDWTAQMCRWTYVSNLLSRKASRPNLCKW
jgi:ankyrin repeat protein